MNILTARLQQKHDIAANWEKSTLVPLAGEIIIYDDRFLNAAHEEIIVADCVRYKIGDGVTPVNSLPFADASELAKKVKELTKQVEGLGAGSLGSLTPVDGTLVISDGTNGNKTIKVAVAPVDGNALVAVEGGLFVPAVPQYTAGNGISLIDNTISVKLADTTHGLVAVDGALLVNLATQETDGAMSKEDKRLLESIPEVYTARKYEISHKPEGTLVDYREDEIRVMCPTNTKFNLQTSGEGTDANTYYIGLKAYAPKNAVCFKEDLAQTISDTKIYYFENNPYAGVDKNNRKYSIVWLPVAKFENDAWFYYGAKSTEDYYVGWYYTIEWYDEKLTKIHSDTLRINLSNEVCHNNNKPYYLADYATSDEVDALNKAISNIEKNLIWGEI